MAFDKSCFIAIFALLASPSPCISLDLSEYQNMIPVTPEEFDSAIGSENLTIAYFLLTDTSSQSQAKNFLKLYNDVIPVLRDYGITPLVVECVRSPHPSCDNRRKNKLYTYQAGDDILAMDTRNVFDEDSFVSNILQILLVDDVPILLTFKEIQHFEHSIKGKHNALFAYFEAIGSTEHRAYIDMAYEYKNDLNFTISTANKVAELFGSEKVDNHGIVWLIKCKDVSKDSAERCPFVRMFDGLSTEGISRFVSSFDLPSVYDSKTVERTPYNQLGLHVINLYYDKDSKDDVMEVARNLSGEFTPGVGIVTFDAQLSHVSYTGALPAYSVQLKDTFEEEFCQEAFTIFYIRRFIYHKLSEYMSGTQSTFDPAVDAEIKVDGCGYRDDLLKLEQEKSRHGHLQKDESEIGHEAYKMRGFPADVNQLTGLTDKNFLQVIKDAPVLMVLYHLKFDVRSQLALHTFANVSRLIGGKSVMAHVDCFNWKRVCDTAKVLTYPTILIHTQHKREGIRYTGRIERDSLVEAVRLLQKDTYMVLPSVKMAHEFLSGSYPGADIRGPANISILGLSDTEEEAKEFQELARIMPDFGFFGLVKGDVATQLTSAFSFKIPGCVVFRHNDPYMPNVEYQGADFTHDSLLSFVRQQQYPIFPELTVASYPLLMRQEKILAILFTKDRAHTSMEWLTTAKVASSKVMEKDVVLVWMDVNDESSIGARYLRTYTYDNKSPQLVAVSHKAGGVTVFPGPFTLELDPIVDWLKLVIMDKLQHVYKLNEDQWKPTQKPFDFLRMKDEGISFDDGEGDGTNHFNDEAEGEGYEEEDDGPDDGYMSSAEMDGEDPDIQHIDLGPQMKKMTGSKMDDKKMADQKFTMSDYEDGMDEKMIESDMKDIADKLKDKTEKKRRPRYRGTGGDEL